MQTAECLRSHAENNSDPLSHSVIPACHEENLEVRCIDLGYRSYVIK